MEVAKRAEADRRKDEFLAMLGHELQNPLAPIVTALEAEASLTPKTPYRQQHLSYLE